MVETQQTINCFVYMYKQLKVICGESHSVNKFLYLKRLSDGKFMEPFKKFQPKDSFIFLFVFPFFSLSPSIEYLLFCSLKTQPLFLQIV